MSITNAHGVFDHIHEDVVRQMAKHIDIRITCGNLSPCKDCAKFKAKQKSVSKERTFKKATEVRERVYLDLSKVTVPKTDGTAFKIKQKHWRSIVDEKTGKKWCDFTATKKEMPEQMCQWLNSMKARGFKVKVIRLDPAGENVALEKRVETAEWKDLQPIDFEFTSRDTPQHNNLAELSFPYIAGIARAMMSAANIPVGTRGKVAIEAIKCATQLDGLVIVKVEGESQARDMHE